MTIFDAVRTTPAAPPEPTPASSRLGVLFACIWLFFLADPLLEGWARRDEVRGVVGTVATVVFAAAYLALWARSRSAGGRFTSDDPLSRRVAWVVLLVVLGGVVIATLGETGLAVAVYVAVACVIVFPVRLAAALVVGLVLVVIALSAVEHWGSQVGTAFATMAASLAVYGVRALVGRNVDLLRAHEENAHLAVENERTRFARDLHDILGHSLTVITVKAELAGRLLDVDTERARAEITDLERLSRDALADVRRAVEGYRDLTLPGELARARTALAAAEIEAVVPGSTDEVPSEVRELFAWTIREGVTNVVRHSAARHCEVVLAPDRAEIRDDGVGAPETTHGSGLLGLRERAAALGATVVTRHLDPGFSLAVVTDAGTGR